MRLLGALLAASLVFVPLGARDAIAEGTVELSARASISASIIDAQPAFDPAFIDARAAASSVGTSSIASVAWPSFLVDAFFFLYGFQSVERIALGIAQAGWPQGPVASRATQSEAFASNLDGVVDRPIVGGASEATATARDARAAASATEATFPGDVTISGATSRADVDRTPGVVRAHAEMRIARIVVGPIEIRGLTATATASPDARARSLTIAEITVAGTPVTLSGDTLIAPSRAAQTLVDQALAATGVQIEILPTRERATGSGQQGLRIAVPVRATDPTGAPHDVRVEFVFGDVRAEAVETLLSLDTPRSGPPSNSSGRTSAPIVVRAPRDLSAPDLPATGAAPIATVERRVVTPLGLPGARATAGGAYGAFLALALALLALRPLVRQAARP